jgi:tetratricopeptide (TPR) repeat protein
LIQSDRLRAVAPFLPAAIVIVGWALWAHFEGAYFPETWYPSAIAAVGLLVATIVGTGRVLPESGSARVVLAALAALVAWTFLSMTWSESPGTGWDLANKLLLYLTVAWALALLPWTPSSVRIALSAWVLATVAVCAVSLIGAATAGSLSEYFIEGRYLDPIGYSNGVSALPLMAFFPALWLSARREAPIWSRAIFLSAAVFLLEFSLLPQSRGAVIGLVVAGLAYIAIVPERLRQVPSLLVVGAAVALSVGPIFHVYTVGIELSEAIEARSSLAGLDLKAAIDDAARPIFITTLGALFVGAALAWADARVRIGAVEMRRIRLGVAAALGSLLFIAAMLALVNAGRISSDLSDRWDTFKSAKDTPANTGERLTANYSDQRYDYWRVAYGQFEQAPMVGAGAGSFGKIYSQERHFDKPSKYVHDIWLRFLGEGGLVALALLAAYLAAVAIGLAGSWRRSGSEGRAMVAICAAVLVYFMTHASFDWLEEFPALASPALALPLLAIVAGGRKAAVRPVATPVRYVLAGFGCLLLVAGLISLALPYLAERHLSKGSEIGLGDVALARKELDRAASLNPLSPEPHLRAGTILVAAHRPRAARREFLEALDVEDNWYAHLELALLESEAGRRKAALARIARAVSLDRHDPLVERAFARLHAGRRLEASGFNSEIRRAEAERFTRPKT